jgi:hypothetical protein
MFSLSYFTLIVLLIVTFVNGLKPIRSPSNTDTSFLPSITGASSYLISDKKTGGRVIYVGYDDETSSSVLTASDNDDETLNRMMMLARGGGM